MQGFHFLGDAGMQGKTCHIAQTVWFGWQKYYRKMMINQDTACMFDCCYDDKQGHLPAHLATTAIFPYARVETDFASTF